MSTDEPLAGSRSGAARRYKDLMAGLTAAVDELRARDRDRAVMLARRLVELDEAMAKAGDRAAVTRYGVALHWEAALEALWAERWMTLRPAPQPDPRSGPADLDTLDALVTQRAERLREALRRRSLRGLRRL